ncbi:MAG: tripartite tricarboxylate transporter substrate binding protein [Desulfobacterales bacterium]|nr:tripartite tricarboxylate transporter substrate binding protein [Desulfobacterales bacterium]
MKTLYVWLVVSICTIILVNPALSAPKYADVEIPDTIRVIVSYNAGGSSDALARITLPHWEKAIKELTGKSTSAIVVNLPGAGGEVGWTSLSHAQADGSTIGIINLPAVPIVQAAREAGFEPWLEKFTALGVNVIDPNVVRLGKRSKFNTLAEAIEAAKKEPGSVTIGADGPLSDDHVAMYALEQATGAKFTFIPYPGGSPANRSFMSGEVDIAIGNVFDHVKTKTSAKEAVVLLNERYPLIEDIPTIKELLGIELGEFGSTRGFAAPTGTPEALVTVYREAFDLAFNDESYKKEAVKRNITIVTPRIGDDFTKVMEENERITQDLLQLFIDGGFIK